MKVSVVTASMNSGLTIARTLKSVESQSWSDLEHIVIDGASTDDTVEIVRGVGVRVSRIVSEPDDGIYSAMNKGVRLATGEIIGFLNADDIYADDDVIESIAMAMQHHDVDAVFGDVAYFKRDPLKVARRYRSDRFHPNRLGWGWMPAHPSLFVRRSVFERTGAFSESYRIAGDFEWITRAFAGQSLRYLYLPRILVLMSLGGISTRGWRSTILLNREVLRACRENSIRTNWLMLLSKYVLKIAELVQR